jgi:hypothetical protein
MDLLGLKNGDEVELVSLNMGEFFVLFSWTKL